ncbi:M56 family metallopeptidase [Maribellus sediminis]|uniref:M56 family metallopeptidase n=1 Tax=Maribellus sediminis TaxID=2696285 RepID=UPI00143144E7|nr:M56 family metallopeptidase [Maribellus sediminis]
MESFLIYIGKSSLAAGAFYLLYLALFQNRKQFVFNRIYLPVSLALSFLIPLITFTSIRYIEARPVEYTGYAYLAESTAVSVVPEFQLQWYHYLSALYVLGMAVFVLYLILGHVRALNIVKNSRLTCLFNVKVNVTLKDVHPFSFFNKIVISENTLEHPGLPLIVQHEEIHVREKHTLDILFAELLFLLQWFNPFAWLIKSAIKDNLEYLTDHEVVKTNNPQAYQLAMLELLHKQSVAPFLTALNGSQLKNRIVMMKKKTENKYALLKQLVVLPLLAILVMGLSNKEVKTEIVQPEKQIEIVVDGKAIPKDDLRLRSVDFSVGINSEIIIDALDVDNVIATSLDITDQINVLYIRTSDYLPGSDAEFEYHTTKNINLDERRLNDEYFYAIDGKIVSKQEFTEKGKKGFENVVFLTGKDATGKYGESYNGVLADATSGVSNFVISSEGEQIDTKINEQIRFHDNDVPDPRTEQFSRFMNNMHKDGNVVLDPHDAELPYITVDGERLTNKLMISEDDIVSIQANQPPWSDSMGEDYKYGEIRITTIKSSFPGNRDDESLTEKQKPEFPGGEPALRNYIQSNLNYPQIAIFNGINGTVYVSFLIDENGKVVNPKVKGGVDPALDKEALRVVSSLPAWKPAEEDGQPVKADYTVPVKFELSEDLMREYKKVDWNGKLVMKYAYSVSGKVTDKQGQPISGAAVTIKGKSIGTVTDTDGNYKIGLNDENESLIFTSMGYQAREISVAGADNLDVRLETDKTSGSAGWTLSGGINGVVAANGDDVTITPSSSNGIKISTYGQEDNQPLYVVDGKIQASLDYLNPADIESLSVLKDQSSTALFGEKGKNGVFLITTKGAEQKTISPSEKSQASISNKAAPESVVKETIYKVTGKVTDENGDPVPGTSVLIKGTTLGTVTDFFGLYEIRYGKPIETLIFKMNGLETIERKVANETTMDVCLKPMKSEEMEKLEDNSVEKNDAVDNPDIELKYGKPVGRSVFSSEPTHLLSSFQVILELNGDRVIMEGSVGCTFRSVEFIASDEQFVKIGPSGMITSNDVKNENFSFELTNKNGEIRLKGDKGTFWTNLSFTAVEGKKYLITDHEVVEVKVDPLIILNGEKTDKSMSEITGANVGSMTILKDATASELYNEEGRNGVVVINTKDYKISTELDLRKFFARNMKYPYIAVENNQEGVAKVAVKTDSRGAVREILDNIPENATAVGEVVVVAYKSDSPEGNGLEHADQVFEKEVKRVIGKLPLIDIPELKGNLVFTVKFVLQKRE